MILPSKKVVR